MNGQECVKFLETLDGSGSWQESLIKLSALGFDLSDEKAALYTYIACLDAFKTLITGLRGKDLEAQMKMSSLYKKAERLKAACRQIAAKGDDEMKGAYLGFCRRLYEMEGFESDKLISGGRDQVSEYRNFINGALSRGIPGSVKSEKQGENMT